MKFSSHIQYTSVLRPSWRPYFIHYSRIKDQLVYLENVLHQVITESELHQYQEQIAQQKAQHLLHASASHLPAPGSSSPLLSKAADDAYSENAPLLQAASVSQSMPPSQIQGFLAQHDVEKGTPNHNGPEGNNNELQEDSNLRTRFPSSSSLLRQRQRMSSHHQRMQEQQRGEYTPIPNKSSPIRKQIPSQGSEEEDRKLAEKLTTVLPALAVLEQVLKEEAERSGTFFLQREAELQSSFAELQFRGNRVNAASSTTPSTPGYVTSGNSWSPATPTPRPYGASSPSGAAPQTIPPSPSSISSSSYQQTPSVPPMSAEEKSRELNELRRKMESMYTEMEFLRNCVTVNRIALEKLARKHAHVVDMCHAVNLFALSAFLLSGAVGEEEHDLAQDLKRLQEEEEEVNRRKQEMAELVAEFCSSPTSRKLLDECERLYSILFSKGIHQRAVAELHAPHNRVPASDVFKLAFCLGLMVPLIVLLFFSAIETYDTTLAPHFGFFSTWPVFRCTGLLIMFVWMWGICLFVWSRTRINHLYLLDLNPMPHLGHLQAWKVAALLTVVWLAFFDLYLGGYRNRLLLLNIDIHIYPMALCCTLLVLLLNPFHMIHSSARKTLLRSFGQLMVTPFGWVAFRHFFLADQLTSMALPIQDIAYSVCFYASGDWSLDDPTYCSSWIKIAGPCFSSIPYLWRFLQCLRMNAKTGSRLHLINAGKYFSSLLVLLFSALHSNLGHGTFEWDIYRKIWMGLVFFTSIYASLWDMRMDWGLLQFNAPYKFLRAQLMYPWKPAYYWAMLSNTLLRGAWCLTVSPAEAFFRQDFFVLFVSLLELIRRSQWNLLRMEWEMFQNDEKYRAQLEVPLAFNVEEKAFSSSSRGSSHPGTSRMSISTPSSSDSSKAPFFAIGQPKQQQQHHQQQQQTFPNGNGLTIKVPPQPNQAKISAASSKPLKGDKRRKSSNAIPITVNVLPPPPLNLASSLNPSSASSSSSSSSSISPSKPALQPPSSSSSSISGVPSSINNAASTSFQSAYRRMLTAPSPAPHYMAINSAMVDTPQEPSAEVIPLAIANAMKISSSDHSLSSRDK